MKRDIERYVLPFLLLFPILIVFCTKKEFRYKQYLLGSKCEIDFQCHDTKIAGLILQEIDQRLHRLDSLLNYFSPHSLVSEINQNGRAHIPGDITPLFPLCDSIARLTDGLFDISVAPLIETWGYYKRQFQNPDTAQITNHRRLVDYQQITLHNDSIITAPSMKIDLGGIAQGYAADQVAEILKFYHITSALINIGGEIVAIGHAPEGRPWRIGIKHPRDKGIIETVELIDYALSTSGDYEKYFTIDDRRYPHIINPKTGFPALEFASVTIFAPSAAYADAMATAVAIMGPEQGMKFLDSLEIRGIIYYEDDGSLQRVEHK